MQNLEKLRIGFQWFCPLGVGSAVLTKRMYALGSDQELVSARARRHSFRDLDLKLFFVVVQGRIPRVQRVTLVLRC